MAPWPDNGFLIRRLEREGAGIEVQETLEGRIAGILVALLAASFGFHFVGMYWRKTVASTTCMLSFRMKLY